MPMKISISKLNPTAQELSEVLQQEFSDRYVYKPFGLGERKSLLVEQSPFSGVQISVNENAITIERVFPSVLLSYVSFILSVILHSDLFLLFPFVGGSSKKLEREVGIFLKKTFN